MIRVAIVTPNMSMGGAERWLVDLVKHSDPQRIHWTGVAVSGFGGADEGLMSELTQYCKAFTQRADLGLNRPSHARPFHYGHFELVNTVNFKDVVAAAAKDAEAIITWGSPKMGFWLDGFDVPKIFCAHTTARETPLHELEGITDITAVSRKAEEYFTGRDLSGISPCEIIYNGVDPKRCEPQAGDRQRMREFWGMTRNNVVIGYLGRQTPEKSPQAAMYALMSLGSNYRAVYYGCDGRGVGPDAELVNWGEVYLPGRTQFYPPVQNIAEVLAGIDVFMLASEREAFSLGMIEAWLAGKPVVATRVGAVAELEARYGQLVFSVPENPTTDDLADAVRLAVQPIAQIVIMRARKVAQEHFTSTIMSERWCDYLERVIRSRPRSRVPALQGETRPEMKLRLTVLMPFLQVSGGVDTWLRSLAKSFKSVQLNILMQKPNCEVDTEAANSLIELGVKIFGSRSIKNLPPEAKYSSILEARARALAQTDVLLTWAESSTAMDTLKQFTGIKLYAVHGLNERVKQQIFTAVFQGGVSELVGVSERAAAILPGTYIENISNGIDFSRLKVDCNKGHMRERVWNIPSNRKAKFVGFVGRMVFDKNPHLIARLVQDLPSEYHCVFIGNGYQEKDVLNEAARLCGHRFIHVKETLDVAKHINALDAMICVSGQESFGYTGLEAMYLGVPVVATPATIPIELLRVCPQPAWMIPEEFTMADLTSATYSAIAGRKDFRIGAARSAVKCHFSSEVMANKWEKHLNYLVCRPPQPKVSVVIPMYNEAERIRKTIMALRNQTLQNYEVIFVDDASTDNTVDIVEELIQDWPAARLIRLQGNVGVSFALNVGFRTVRGVYCTWYNADSWPDFQWLQVLSNALDDNPGVVMAYGDWLRCENGKTRYSPVRPNAHLDIIEGQGIGPCWLFRTEAKDTVGDYTTYATSEDRDMHIKLSKVGPFLHVPMVLGTWLSHTQNMTSTVILHSLINDSEKIRLQHLIQKITRRGGLDNNDYYGR